MKLPSRKKMTRNYVQSARAQSAEETAQRIVEAFLACLMTEWFDKITLDRVAADAQVTVQTILRRFGGKEGLLTEAVKVLTEQVNARRAMPCGSIDRVADALMKDYEHIGDAILRLLSLEPRVPALQEMLSIGRAEHRRWLATVYEIPLARLDATARRRALDALVLVTDVYTWKLLRRDMARSVPESRATMKRLLGSTVDAFLGPQPNGDQP